MEHINTAAMTSIKSCRANAGFNLQNEVKIKSDFIDRGS